MAGLNIKRRVFTQIHEHMPSPDITVMIGARQVGKTTILELLRESLIKNNKVKPHNILSFNLDIESDSKNFESQEEFIKLLKLKSGNEKLYVFVDEVQRIKNPGRFFKGIFDLKMDIKFVLTGSSSLEIRSKVSEALTGRKKLFQIYGFDFEEFLESKNKELVDYLDVSLEKLPQTYLKEITNLYQEYITFGGYPKVVLSKTLEEKISELEEIYQSYIDKDVIGLLKIGDSNSFKKLLRLLANQVSGLLNIEEVSRNIGITYQTINKYLDIMEQTYIIFPLSPYYTNPGTELKKSKKYYFHDNGIRNLILSNLDLWSARNDKGQLFENSVAQILTRNTNPSESLHYWRTKSKAEVDFILRSRDIKPYEAKLKYEFTRSFRSFMDNYKPKEGILVNLEEQKEHSYKDYTIRSIMPWQIKSHIKTKS